MVQQQRGDRGRDEPRLFAAVCSIRLERRELHARRHEPVRLRVERARRGLPQERLHQLVPACRAGWSHRGPAGGCAAVTRGLCVAGPMHIIAGLPELILSATGSWGEGVQARQRFRLRPAAF